jgi:hypothetical protein
VWQSWQGAEAARADGQRGSARLLRLVDFHAEVGHLTRLRAHCAMAPHVSEGMQCDRNRVLPEGECRQRAKDATHVRDGRQLVASSQVL